MDGPHYFLNLKEASSQRFEVELRFIPQVQRLKLQLPVWTPGSYLERAYSRHLEGLTALQGSKPLKLKRFSSDAWLLEVQPQTTVIVKYTLLAVTESVRTNWLDHNHGFLTAAAWALEVEGQRWLSHRVSLDLPNDWQVATSLNKCEANTFSAINFDQLLDSPLALGQFSELVFEVGGVPHRWVWQGLTEAAPIDQWRWQLPVLCRSVCRLLGVEKPPTNSYLFLIRFCDQGYGGLEHTDNTALIFSRNDLKTPEGQRSLLQLVAHEYLHQWNIKRIRPQELRPYNYADETIFPTLWFAEGVTSYYDSLLVLRAGLCSELDYFKDLAKEISRYRLTPGRQIQSLEQSSEEAWVKLYRRDCHSDNQQISYYLKGQLVALMLDLHLLAIGSSLQALLRKMWNTYGIQERGYTQQDLINISATFDSGLVTLLPAWLEGTADLRLEEQLKSVGMNLLADNNKQAYSGINLALWGAELRINMIDRNSPAESACLYAGDEILAIDNVRCRTVDFFEKNLNIDQLHTLVISHDGLVQNRQLIPQAPQPRAWSLKIDENAVAEIINKRQLWLHG
ncbi:MAG: M61 family metallopeptidase [Synechococcus sp. SupBloom_Metag_053]|nr:M61 family metallopeptidase [Synechococcus sp. SupBloom_Metag_053]